MNGLWIRKFLIRGEKERQAFFLTKKLVRTQGKKMVIW